MHFTQYPTKRSLRFANISTVNRRLKPKTRDEGEQFENFLVVFGRGWNKYDFNLYLKIAENSGLIGTRAGAYEHYRNLFYVAAFRSNRRLALVFIHLLDPDAMATLSEWFAGQPVREYWRGAITTASAQRPS